MHSPTYLISVTLKPIIFYHLKNCTFYEKTDDNDDYDGMVDRRKASLALFPSGTTVRDPHHRESPTRRKQGLNLRRA